MHASRHGRCRVLNLMLLNRTHLSVWRYTFDIRVLHGMATFGRSTECVCAALV